MIGSGRNALTLTTNWTMAKLHLRIDFATGGSVGPGKIRLLEEVRKTGSISAAARAMEMSYRRAWLLIDDLNRIFCEPVVSAATGGRHGGGAILTGFGQRLVDQYRAIEEEAFSTSSARIDALRAVLRPVEEHCTEDATLPPDTTRQPVSAGIRQSMACPSPRPMDG